MESSSQQGAMKKRREDSLEGSICVKRRSPQHVPNNNWDRRRLSDPSTSPQGQAETPDSLAGSLSSGTTTTAGALEKWPPQGLVKPENLLGTLVSQQHTPAVSASSQEFQWRRYGNKLLTSSVRRYYYACAEKDTTGCEARKTVSRTRREGQRSEDTSIYSGEHNHPSPSKTPPASSLLRGLPSSDQERWLRGVAPQEPEENVDHHRLGALQEGRRLHQFQDISEQQDQALDAPRQQAIKQQQAPEDSMTTQQLLLLEHSSQDLALEQQGEQYQQRSTGFEFLQYQQLAHLKVGLSEDQQPQLLQGIEKLQGLKGQQQHKHEHYAVQQLQSLRRRAQPEMQEEQQAERTLLSCLGPVQKQKLGEGRQKIEEERNLLRRAKAGVASAGVLSAPEALPNSSASSTTLLLQHLVKNLLIPLTPTNRLPECRRWSSSLQDSGQNESCKWTVVPPGGEGLAAVHPHGGSSATLPLSGGCVDLGGDLNYKLADMRMTVSTTFLPKDLMLQQHSLLRQQSERSPGKPSPAASVSFRPLFWQANNSRTSLAVASDSWSTNPGSPPPVPGWPTDCEGEAALLQSSAGRSKVGLALSGGEQQPPRGTAATSESVSAWEMLAQQRGTQNITDRPGATGNRSPRNPPYGKSENPEPSSVPQTDIVFLDPAASVPLQISMVENEVIRSLRHWEGSSCPPSAAHKDESVETSELAPLPKQLPRDLR